MDIFRCVILIDSARLVKRKTIIDTYFRHRSIKLTPKPRAISQKQNRTEKNLIRFSKLSRVGHIFIHDSNQFCRIAPKTNHSRDSLMEHPKRKVNIRI